MYADALNTLAHSGQNAEPAARESASSLRDKATAMLDFEEKMSKWVIGVGSDVITHTVHTNHAGGAVRQCGRHYR